MTSVRIEIEKKVLSWALERIKTKDAEKLYRKFPHLNDWLDGTIQPTLRQLEEFSAATHVPFGYLLLPEPPEESLPIPHFRTISDRTTDEYFSPELLDTVQIMQLRQDWMRDYLIELGHEPLPFVGSASSNENPCMVAQHIRETLSIIGNWASKLPNWDKAFQLLLDKTEEAGILVAINSIVGNNTHRKLDVNEFRGFVLVDEYAPLVFINGGDGKAAQMFTLAHELAHIWVGKSAAFDLRNLEPAQNETEWACNRIAAEFLTPAKALHEYWPSIKNEANVFQTIARNFKVSEIVAARRLLDLNLISRNDFFFFYQQYQEKNRQRTKKKGGGPNFYDTQYRRLGRNFGEAVVYAVAKGNLLHNEAYRLTGLYGKTFNEFATRVLGQEK